MSFSAVTGVPSTSPMRVGIVTYEKRVSGIIPSMNGELKARSTRPPNSFSPTDPSGDSMRPFVRPVTRLDSETCREYR